jgi:hypothetical protein
MTAKAPKKVPGWRSFVSRLINSSDNGSLRNGQLPCQWEDKPGKLGLGKACVPPILHEIQAMRPQNNSIELTRLPLWRHRAHQETPHLCVRYPGRLQLQVNSVADNKHHPGTTQSNNPLEHCTVFASITLTSEREAQKRSVSHNTIRAQSSALDPVF